MYCQKLERKPGKINSLLGPKDLARSSTGYQIKTFTAVQKKICQSFNSSLYKQMMPAIHGFIV